MISHLRSMLGRLQAFFPKRLRQTPWLVFFSLVVVVGFTLYFNEAKAELDVGGYIIRAMGSMMLTIASIAIGFTIFFLRFFIAIAAYNNYIDVSVVQLGWIMVRDVANMFFVVALLVIAFGTILGLEEYEWKKNLVKLILAAILINFSNLIAQLVIDVAHVFTITFLNAISATAGGNLINMFKLDQITAMIGQNADDSSSIDLTLLAAVIPAMMFAIMAACALGAYVFVMMARVVALWALIILSPLAFILGVLPKTKSYAEKWWSEFSKYVIVAPIMVFFLWLSFATLGQGNIAKQIQTDPNFSLETDQSKDEFGPQKLSLSKVTTWENMANFLIAFAFLMYGIKTTQDTGVIGSSAVGSAVEIGKKIGSFASNYGAARWLASGAMELGKKGIKGALWHAPLIGGEKWANRAKTEWGSIRSWYYGKASSIKVDQIGDKINDKSAELNKLKEKKENKTITAEEEAKMPELQKEIEGLQKEQKGFFTRGGIVGMLARGGLSEERRANKATKLADQRREIAYKRTGSESGGFVFGTGGVLRHVGLGDESFKDQDRREKGILEVEENRSDTKTGKMSAEGRAATLGRYRIKDGKMEDQPREGEEAMTMAEQVASQIEGKSKSDKQSDELLSAAKQKFFEGSKGKKTLEARIKAELNIKASEAETKRMEAGGLTGVAVQDKKNADLAKQIYERSRGRGATKEAAIEEVVKRGLVSEDLARQMAAPGAHAEELLTGVVGRTIASEKQAHTEGMKLEQLEKSEERKYYGGRHGQHELKEEAELKAKMATDDAVIKEMEEKKIKEFSDTGEGRDLIKELNLAEQGKKAAEEFVKNIKEKDFTDAFKKAGEEIERIIDEFEADPEKVAEKVREAGKSDNYIAALNASQDAGEISKEKQVRERQAVDSAHDALIGLGQGGRTPSTVLGELGEKEKNEYKILERTQGMKLAADRMAYLHMKKSKLAPGEDLSIADQVSLKGAMDFIDSEAWNDDIADHVFGEIARLKKGDIDANSLEGKKAQALEKFFIDGMGWEYEFDDASKKFKIKSGYDGRMSGDLQIFASLGGDLEALKAHRKTEALQNEQVAEKEVGIKEKLQKGFDNRKARALDVARSRIDEDSLKEDTEKKYAEIAEDEMTDADTAILDSDPSLKADFNKAKKNPVALKAFLAAQPALAGLTTRVDEAVERTVRERIDAAAELMSKEILNEQETVALSKARSSVDDYDTILKKLSESADGGQSAIGMRVEEYLKRLKAKQDFMQTSARIYKQNALTNGHLESHSIGYSPTLGAGMLRPMTVSEGRTDLIGEIVKRDSNVLAKTQFHSAGKVDLNSHLFENVNEAMYRSLYGQIAHEYEIKSMPLRTLLRYFGYGTGETARKSQGHMFLGGNQMDVQFKRGTTERGKHIVTNLMLPEIFGNTRAFLFSLKRMGNHVSTKDISKGIIKTEIDGFGKVKDLTELAQLIEANKDEMGVSDYDLFRLKEIAAEYARGVDLGGGSTGRKAEE